MSRVITVLLIFFCTQFASFAEESKGEVDPKKLSAATKLDQETLSEMERIRKEPRISSDFSRGEYLIYDCRNRNYACVNEPSFQKCRKFRDDGYKNKKMLLPCAPLKEMGSQEECFKKHYELIHNQLPKAFCQNTKNAKY